MTTLPGRAGLSPIVFIASQFMGNIHCLKNVNSWSRILLVRVRIWEVLMRITSKGQVTIPLEVRQATGLLPNCEVEFEVKGNKVLIRKADKRPLRGERIVGHLRGRGSVKMSTDEIMALTRGE